MSNEEEIDQQTEDRQMNWFAAGILALGSPLFVMAFMGHHWAEIACKVYVWTSSTLGCILFFIERRSLNQRWLWRGMVPVVVVHAAVMYGVVLFNRAFPNIDRFPIATYGVIVPLIGLEVGMLELVLAWFKPVRCSEQSRASSRRGGGAKLGK